MSVARATVRRVPPSDTAETLASVAAALPGGGEDRPGQTAMAEAVERAISTGRNLVVQAGTGTGKSLAYLVPALRSGRTVVVATATKALQDQLATKDLPFLADKLGDRRAFSFAVLKGRSNYVCRQRVDEMSGGLVSLEADPVLATDEAAGEVGEVRDREAADDQGVPAIDDSVSHGGMASQARRIIGWSATATSGDRADLDFEPHSRVWAMLSVSARECPGAFRCPSGGRCFAERARDRAAEADVVVVNTHLYATHVKSEGTVLPDHEVLILDEAHAVEDIMAAALGIELAAGRFRALAQSARSLVGADDGPLVDALLEAADALDVALKPRLGRRVLGGTPVAGAVTAVPGAAPAAPAATDEVGRLLALARGRVVALTGALRRAGNNTGDGGDPDADARGARAIVAAGHLIEDLDVVARLDDGQVAWVEASGQGGRSPTLRVAPVDVGPVLAERLWPDVTAVLTSATVPPLLETRLGLPRSETDRLDVGSPFPFERNALLYCAAHLPDPRRAEAATAIHDELGDLIRAAGGRTLALFTSRRAMQAATDALRPVLPYRVMAQDDLPKPRLLEVFAAEESACLFATMSFWQGVDVPGSTLSLVALDRLPFARPDDPLLDARRQRAGDNAFRLVDLPRAATLLAQGAGRLIRSSTDTGVVAVLDPRLVTAGYGRTLRSALPPMRLTTRKADALEFLRAIA